jgi:hypothetical protein
MSHWSSSPFKGASIVAIVHCCSICKPFPMLCIAECRCCGAGAISDRAGMLGTSSPGPTAAPSTCWCRLLLTLGLRKCKWRNVCNPIYFSVDEVQASCSLALYRTRSCRQAASPMVQLTMPPFPQEIRVHVRPLPHETATKFNPRSILSAWAVLG